MIRIKRIIFLFLLITETFYGKAADQLVIYPVPKEIIYTHHNDDYTVKVRTPGGDWQDLYEYNVIVDMDNPQNASMVQFDFSGKVDVFIKKNNGLLHTIDIRPLSKGIIPVISGNIITFTLDRPQKLSIEFNGDRLRNLHLFANPIETDIPDKNDPDVIWFEPGIHTPKDLPGIQFNIPSNKTIYIEGGAILRGKLLIDKSENVQIRGRGIIEQAQRGIEITHSRNVEIDGITVINPDHYTIYGGEVNGLTIQNLKSFSSKGWSDGIDLMSCSNVEIDDIFMRNSDDCIAIYTHRWRYYGDAGNYKISNAILWADIAHPINIGLHGNTEIEGYTIENIHIKDIDILEHDEDDRNYQGCIAFSVSDHNLVKDVVIEDVRIENIQEGQLLNLRVLYNEKYSHGPGRGIKNVTFRNISYTGYGENPSIIEGYSEKNRIENVSFENIVINGKRAANFDEANIRVGNYTHNITIR